MGIHHAILLFFAGGFAGAVNAVAGGGSFVSFPTLLFTGVPPVPANATNTVALLVGTAASGGAYRKRLTTPRRVLIPFVIAGLLGGLGGAFLLVKTPAETFLRVIPWMLLAATLLFAFSRRITKRFAAHISHEASTAALAIAAGLELIVGLYGGYFGGGIGIIMLAIFSALGMTDIHAMNALKVILASVINGVATIFFIVAKIVYWPQALVMTAGALIGGFTSAHLAQKLPHGLVRGVVIVCGCAMTAYFFYRGYFVGHS